MRVTLELGDDVERTPRGIALAIGRLIDDGRVEVGARLPTVRAAAKELGVSTTTVSEAWRILRSHGAIRTEGRRGTFVRGRRQGAAPGRYWQVPVDAGTFALDLSTGTPDPRLLPDLGPLLARVRSDLQVTSYLDPPVLPRLEEHLVASWPFEPEAFTIVDGAQDALDRLVQALVGLGTVVLVEDPCFPPLLDMLDLAGAEVVGLPLDDEGVRVDALVRELQRGPTALFLQPRAHNPTGITMTAGRALALAEVLEGTDVLVVEDDHSAAVSGAALASLGASLPGQVVHIRSHSKSHGPDLRLAAVGGAAGPVDAVVRRRRMGPSWSSRLLQQLLLDLLTDAVTMQAVAGAEERYAERRRRFVTALADAGVETAGDAGFNVWVPVVDEQIALVALAAQGIGAAPGAPFVVAASEQGHLRLSIGTVADDLETLAGQVARAALAVPGGAR